MKITSIHYRNGDNHKVLSFVDIVVDNLFQVNDLRIVKRDDDSVHVIGPAYPKKKGCTCGKSNIRNACYCNWCGKRLIPLPPEYKEIFHPVNESGRSQLETILSGFKRNVPN